MSASTDSQFVQKAFSTGLGGVSHPILADNQPKGAVAQAYGVYNDAAGFAQRSVFVIDKDGVIRFKQVYAQGLPDVEDVLKEVEKLQ